LIFLSALTGCGEPFHRVSGKVTFEGKPLQGGGSISFIPLGEQRGAGGEIGPDGSYTLTTVKNGDGAMVGEYRVAIIQVTEKEPESVPDGQKVKVVPASSVAAADRIPLIYADQSQSPLKAKVEAKGLNELNFDLKKK